MKKHTQIVFVSALFFALTANAHGGGPDIIVDPTQVDQADVTQVDQYDYDPATGTYTKKPFLGGLRSDIDRFRAGTASRKADRLRRRADRADARALRRWERAERRDAQTLQALRDREARLLAEQRERQAELLRRYGSLGGGKPGANPVQVDQNDIIVSPSNGGKPGSDIIVDGSIIVQPGTGGKPQHTSVYPVPSHTREIISHREVEWSSGDATTPYVVRTIYVDPNAGREPSTETSTEVGGGKDPVVVNPNTGTKPGKDPVVVNPNTGTKPGKDPVVVNPNTGTKPGKDPVVVNPNTGTKPGKDPVVVNPNTGTKPGKDPVIVTPNTGTKPGKDPVVVIPTQVDQSGGKPSKDCKEKDAKKLAKKAQRKENRAAKLERQAAELRAREAAIKQCLAESTEVDPAQKQKYCEQKVTLGQKIGKFFNSIFGKKDKKLSTKSPAVSEITISKTPAVSQEKPVIVETQQPEVGNLETVPELTFKSGKI